MDDFEARPVSAIRATAYEQSGNRQSDATSSDVSRISGLLAKGLFSEARLVAVSIDAGATKHVAHGLRRAPTGWILSRPTHADAHTVYEVATNNADPTAFLQLCNPSATKLTIDLVVF